MDDRISDFAQVSSLRRDIFTEGRGKGLTQTMYKVLFAAYQNANIVTRTWSTNTAYIRILSRFDYETFCVSENDRGNGIDTVYFKKATK